MAKKYQNSKLRKAQAVTTSPVQDEDESASPNLFRRLYMALQSKKKTVMLIELARFQASTKKPTLDELNIVLEAFIYARRQHTSIGEMLRTYSLMASYRITPNEDTYILMVVALCIRDQEVSSLIKSYKYLESWPLIARTKYYAAEHKIIIGNARGEQNFMKALENFHNLKVLRPTGTNALNHHVYCRLLQACADHGDINSAKDIFEHLQLSTDAKPNASCYLQLLLVYVNAGDMLGAKAVMKNLHMAVKKKEIQREFDYMKEADVDPLYVVGSHGSYEWTTHKFRRPVMLMWCHMIRGFFFVGEPGEAIDLFERMLDSTAELLFNISDIPHPCSFTYTIVIEGLFSIGKTQSVIEWFEKLVAFDSPPNKNPLYSLSRPTRPDQSTWITFFDGLMEYYLFKEAFYFFHIYVQLVEGGDHLRLPALMRYALFHPLLDTAIRQTQSST